MKKPIIKGWKVRRALPIGNKYPDAVRYRWAFELFDQTPGGSNLGRIEWHLEAFPLRARRRLYIGGLLVWATQTRDSALKGRAFWIPCFSEALSSARKPDDFFPYVWRVGFCKDHHVLSWDAYPPNGSNRFEVHAESSIGIDLKFLGESV